MNDRKLRELLRDLPRATAREGFKDEVLARWDAERADPPSQRPAGTWGLRVALAAAATLAVLLPAGVWVAQRGGEAPARAQGTELAALRAEHRQIQNELRELMQLGGSRQDSVVYLGGNEDLDLVLDLNRVRRAGGAAGDRVSYDDGAL